MKTGESRLQSIVYHIACPLKKHEFTALEATLESNPGAPAFYAGAATPIR
jgi:hypothetical protein